MESARGRQRLLGGGLFIRGGIWVGRMTPQGLGVMGTPAVHDEKLKYN